MSQARLEIPPKLIPVFADAPGEVVRYRGAYGGRGSAKTQTFALMSAVHGYRCGMAGKEGIILCAREFMNSLDESSMEEVKAAIRKHDFLANYYDISERQIRSKDGRIRYAFSGLSRNVDSIKSKSRILLAWVDEAEPTREQSYQKLIPTVREDDSEVWVTWNPEDDQSPTHLRFRVNPPPFSKIVEMNWRDNPWFPGVLEMERVADKERRPDTYEHVWEGGFNIAVEGAYFARYVAAAEAEGRVGDFPHDPSRPVLTSWDIGVDDYTVIWFWQESLDGQHVTVVDFYEVQNLGAEQIVAEALPEHGEDLRAAAARMVEMGRRSPYRYGAHYLPHDVKLREWGAGARSRVETLMGLGLRGIRKGAALGPEERINAARKLLPLVRFNDTPAVRVGLRHLRRYSRRRNEQMGLWQGPLHDEHSHSADAFGEYAVNSPLVDRTPAPKRKAWNPQQGVKIGPPEPKRGARIKL